ncbi:hypothetical protein C8Q73DRAFT_354249 [Cubamyces lactineus]|nr:hypothetical protein C8Q73DRAFT_354249 [Cubamyces lactineus]
MSDWMGSLIFSLYHLAWCIFSELAQEGLATSKRIATCGRYATCTVLLSVLCELWKTRIANSSLLLDDLHHSPTHLLQRLVIS